ncbi:hypothetical protein [Leptospira gomenensis]|nr:hypothetical protein [Leptospira gomenensis]
MVLSQIYRTTIAILLCSLLIGCGKKNKEISKPSEAHKKSSVKKNDLDLEPDIKERKFFQEDAFGQPKKYVEPESAQEEVVASSENVRPKKENKSLNSYVGSPPGCKSGNCNNGNGIFVYDSGEVYSGSFKNEQRHGFGSIQYKDGDRFSGGFRFDKKYGPGTYRFSSGAIFSGRFLEDGESAEGFLTVGKKRKECSILRNRMSCSR